MYLNFKTAGRNRLVSLRRSATKQKASVPYRSRDSKLRSKQSTRKGQSLQTVDSSPDLAL